MSRAIRLTHIEVLDYEQVVKKPMQDLDPLIVRPLTEVRTSASMSLLDSVVLRRK